MKLIITSSIALSILVVSLSAGEFEKKSEMMNSRIYSKMEQFQGNAQAQDFLSKKLACVQSSKTVEDLKICKSTYHPKHLKKLLK